MPKRFQAKLTFTVLSTMLVLAFVFPVYAASDAPLMQWEKVYGYMTGNCAIQTSDGGYAIAGTSADYDPTFLFFGNNTAILIKTDSAGNLQWQKSFLIPTSGSHAIVTQDASGKYVITGTPPIESSSANSVFQTADGGYVIAGVETWIYDGQWDGVTVTNGKWGVLFLLKTSSEGNEIWKRNYEPATPDGGSAVDVQLSTAIQTNDEGYALIGIINWRVAFVVKTDSIGNLQWNKTYESDVNGAYNRLFSIIEISDGSFIVAGDFGVPRFFKIDPNGSVQSSRVYNQTNSDFFGFIKTNDGGYLWVGDKVQDSHYTGCTFKINEQGDVLWNKTYVGTGSFRSVAQTPDGGYILVEYNQYWVQLAKIDAYGNFEWSKVYGQALDRAQSVFVTNDGGYAFVGRHLEGLPKGKYDSTLYRSWALLAKTAPPSTVSVPPMLGIISIIDPKNQTYAADNLSLTFAFTGSVSWIGYSLDLQVPVNVTQNSTLTGLTNGMHSLTVYATDAAGNTFASETVYFTITELEPFPTTWIVVTVVVALVGVGLMVYFARVKKKRL